MKNIILLLFLIFLSSCNKIEMPEDKDTDQHETPDQPITPPSEGDYLSIQEALAHETNNDVSIQGYIVGYIDGTSIKTASKFTLPEYENTNMLLADQPYETDYNQCLPVKLEKTGKYATRELLNLFDNPEFLHQHIKINGFLAKYFSRNGIIRVYECEIAVAEEDGEDPTPSDSITYPDITDEEEYIPEGRNAKK